MGDKIHIRNVSTGRPLCGTLGNIDAVDPKSSYLATCQNCQNRLRDRVLAMLPK